MRLGYREVWGPDRKKKVDLILIIMIVHSADERKKNKVSILEEEITSKSKLLTSQFS